MADARIRIVVDGEEANLTLGEIDNKLQALNAQADGLDQTTDEFRRLTEQIALLKKAAGDLRLVVEADVTAAQEALDGLAAAQDSMMARIERSGVQGVGAQVAQDLGLRWQFIDIDNPA